MKIFVDSANVDEIRKLADIGIIDGVTTNPTLIAKEGRNFKEVVEEICTIVDGPISAEVTVEDSGGMVKEARELAKLHKNIVIKIPMTSEGLKATKKLSSEGIKTNVTLVFSANQAIATAKAGATYVSPFVGRLDDIGENGMLVVKDMIEIFKNYNFKTEVIVASIRHPMHVLESALLGAPIATIPPKIIWQMFNHPLTDKGIKTFMEDAKKI